MGLQITPRDKVVLTRVGNGWCIRHENQRGIPIDDGFLVAESADALLRIVQEWTELSIKVADKAIEPAMV
jgi:hypothetical protein